ncbi:hypothetical protein [Fodinicola feengrottensis]|uniref:hypothetical protein n=1 Tax=Fodinicola feengrottensis TaxID=435914 RepID=UPI002443646A|nr:hypothetical protein [Fodinicola feengrottensis]
MPSWRLSDAPTPPDPRRRDGRRPRDRAGIPAVSAAPPPAAGDRQQAFAAAAQHYGVPETVLLGVSYLESRWDDHAGSPSSSGGYGPMNLTDARYVVDHAPAASGSGSSSASNSGSGSGSGDFGDDPRGDANRPAGPAARARVGRRPRRAGPAHAPHGRQPDRHRRGPAADRPDREHRRRGRTAGQLSARARRTGDGERPATGTARWAATPAPPRRPGRRNSPTRSSTSSVPA